MAPEIGMVKQTAGPARKHGLRTRDVFSYVLLPKVLPRFAELFFTGFSFFAFFIAQVYRGVRLLPDGHPSLNPANIGEFGIRDVIGAAARNLVWRKENIDQIIIFIAILLGLVLLVLQAATFIIALAMPSAVAAGLSSSSLGFSSLFGTPAGGNAQDIAFILLDRVFGVPGIFGSCISSSTPCYGVSADAMSFDKSVKIFKPDVFPWPYHHGLHALFQFYSMGLLLVAVFILLYLVIVIVAETAQTGTPFGKRFNTVWAPIRLVMALGLLIPISNGLNSAQYITLYAAKWGSNFATNGWVLFNNTLDRSNKGNANALAGNMNLAVMPKEPDAQGLLQFMTLAHTCKIYEETLMAVPEDTSAAYTTETKTAATKTEPEKTTKTNSSCTGSDGVFIEAYLVKPGIDAANSYKFLRDTDYNSAVSFAENRDIKIRFGDRNCEKANTMAGNVQPTCGEITLPINSLTDVGPSSIQAGYYKLIQALWGGYSDGGSGILSYSRTDAADNKEKKACTSADYNKILNSGTAPYDRKIREYALSYYQNGTRAPKTGICEKDDSQNKNTTYDLLPWPKEGWQQAATKHYMYGANEQDTSAVTQNVSGNTAYAGAGDTSLIIRNILKKGVTDLQKQLDGPPCGSSNKGTDSAPCNKYSISDDNRQRGWAAAGIWYNKIAEMNGSLIGAAWDIPAPNRYPQIMMGVLAIKRQNDAQVAPNDMFSPQLAGGKSIVIRGGDNGTKYAIAMNDIYKDWTASRPKLETGNVMADFVNVIFGTQGLFDLRYSTNRDAHPLAQLVGVGKGLIEASIRNLGIGMGSGLLSIVAGLAVGGGASAELTSAISSFFFSIATMTLTAGFILFYVIPFLPFLYFFFAVGNWLKGVFEAMVGVPLWALAHLRIDGNGLPGEAAVNGYFMLFEIFLRPIMILFGFFAAISIFSAMATVFHEVFEVAVSNLTGAGTTGGASKAIDNFFYTCMYAVIMYIMALSSFKLIDLIPNQIMRWMGTNVSTFSDMQGDPAGNLTQMTAIAGNSMVGGMTQGLKEGMGGMRSAAGAAHDYAAKLGTPPK